MEGLCPYNRQRGVMLAHVRGVTISVGTTQPEVYKLKGGVITWAGIHKGLKQKNVITLGEKS